MKPEEIAMQLTLKAMEHKSEKALLSGNHERNKEIAQEISKFYKTIYKAVAEVNNASAEEIYIGSSK